MHYWYCRWYLLLLLQHQRSAAAAEKLNDEGSLPLLFRCP